MRFNSETAAWEYWQQAYMLSGGDLEVIPFDELAVKFHEWVKREGVTWLDEETRIFIDTWENSEC